MPLSRLLLSCVATFAIGSAPLSANTGDRMSSPPCAIIARKVFQPQGQHVAVAGQKDGGAQYILFNSALRVNTDGAPNSYHPNDLPGQRLAINNIANGVVVRNNANQPVSFEDTLKVFGQFRDGDWHVPDHFDINWRNVIAARNIDGRLIPCVFSSGPFQGYFGSLTALKNGLPASDAGECEANNQLDERVIPALVIAGGDNPLRAFGAHTGDLALAINPSNFQVSAAVIGDVGPPANLGEGSVALNMALLGRTEQPKTYAEAKKLDTGQQKIVVVILPKTEGFNLQRPYTPENIAARVQTWATANQFGSVRDFANQALSCSRRLNR